MPVVQRDILNARVVLHALVGDEGDADAGGHQGQGRPGGIHGADDGFVRVGAAGPFLEAFHHIIIEDHLAFAVVKETAKRFTDNEKVEVTAS